jgi:hypothetical protein
MVAMGLVQSWWRMLASPAAALIGFAFAGANGRLDVAQILARRRVSS